MKKKIWGKAIFLGSVVHGETKNILFLALATFLLFLLV